MATSDGELVEEGRFAKRAQDRLDAAQRALATKSRGSRRRQLARERLAAHHRKIANQRRDLAHKLSRRLVNDFDLICVEDIKIAAMPTYKAEEAGRKLVIVDPRHTSQRCAACGHTANGNRPSQAVFRCRSCGHHDHADVNAARNILGAGRALRAQDRAGSTAN
jgi:putative transposase